MERAEFRRILQKAVYSFKGYTPLGIFADINESDYYQAVPEDKTIQKPDIFNEIVKWYFSDLEANLEFDDNEHLWILGTLLDHMDLIGNREIKLICDLYLKMVTSKAYSRILCIAILVNIDKKLSVNSSFLSYMVKALRATAYSQKDVLIDLIDILVDLKAIPYKDRAIYLLLKYGVINNLTYIEERVMFFAEAYGQETVDGIRSWIDKCKQK